MLNFKLAEKTPNSNLNSQTHHESTYSTSQLPLNFPITNPKGYCDSIQSFLPCKPFAEKTPNSNLNSQTHHKSTYSTSQLPLNFPITNPKGYCDSIIQSFLPCKPFSFTKPETIFQCKIPKR